MKRVSTNYQTHRIQITYLQTILIQWYRTKLPMRSMLVAPSGAGKTVFLTNMILDIYKGCFSRVCIWSPSIYVDNAWTPVKYYINITIKPTDREKCIFDDYNPSEVETVIQTQQKS